MTSNSATGYRFKSVILALGNVLVFLILLMLLSQLKHFLPQKFERYALGILGTIAALGSVWIFSKYEKISLQKLGLLWQKNTLRKFLMGLLLGILIAAAMIFIQVSYAGMTITLNENGNFLSFLLWSSALIPLAFMEEVAFRSYPFIKLNKAVGLRLTQFVMAFLFAIYHILDGGSLVNALIGPGIWGLAFGLAAVISNGISMPTGLHYGLNLILALLGTKNEIRGLFTIDYPSHASAEAVQAGQNAGIALQLAVLLLCILGMEIYLRKRKSYPSTLYNPQPNNS